MEEKEEKETKVYEKGTMGWLKQQAAKDGFSNIREWQIFLLEKKEKRFRLKRVKESMEMEEEVKKKYRKEKERKDKERTRTKIRYWTMENGIDPKYKYIKRKYSRKDEMKVEILDL